MLIQILSSAHNITTLIFGIFISAFLLGIKQNRENVLKLFLFFCADGLLFIALYFLLGNTFSDNIYSIYPFITHLPLILFLIFYYKYPALSSMVSVFSAYMCCQLSNWGGLLLLHLTGSECCYYFVRVLITIAVFFFLCKYVCHTTTSIFQKDTKVLCMIGFLPFIYYVLDYAFTKFSNLLYTGNKVIVELYGFSFCIAYIVFLFIYFREYEQKRESRQYGILMEMQLKSIQSEIDQSRASEQTLSIFRHDMRHDMNILHTLIESGKNQDALDYIKDTVEDYDSTAITKYCSSEMVNSVISIYKTKFEARDLHLNCDINCENVNFSEIDFCTILSNALENSMHAIEGLNENLKWTKLSISNKGNSVLLKLENPTSKTPRFVDGIPVSDKKGHGFGVKSIIYYVDKMNGQWQFSINDGKFIMQVII